LPYSLFAVGTIGRGRIVVVDVRLSLVLVLEILMSHVTVAQRRMIVLVAVRRAQMVKAALVMVVCHMEMLVGV
jgi:hypothetical protein